MIMLAGQSNMVNMERFFRGGPTTCVARGGTSIIEWLPGTECFENLRPYLKAGVTALLFWQGETDAIEGGEPALHWGKFFEVIATACRAEQPGLPILFGETPAIDGALHTGTVRQQQAECEVLGLATMVRCPASLPLEDPHHLAAESLAFMAERFRLALEQVAVAAG